MNSVFCFVVLFRFVLFCNRQYRQNVCFSQSDPFYLIKCTSVGTLVEFSFLVLLSAFIIIKLLNMLIYEHLMHLLFMKAHMAA